MRSPIPRTSRRASRVLAAPVSALFVASLAIAGCDAKFDVSTHSDSEDSDVFSAPAGSAPSSTPQSGIPGSGTTTPAPAASSLPLPTPAVAPRGAPQTFADLAQAADPAVVFVRVVQSQRSVFGRFLQEGSGSGFIFDASGLVLTNNHVVEGAEGIAVELFDGRTFSARILGRDAPTDVAVLKIEASSLPVLPFGDSQSMRVGDWVLAIGNPFGLQHTVSAGIISAKDRSQGVSSGDSYVSYLQTDASINPGNSGGPLLDTSGRVIGINTAIRAEANSIGFAIPIDMVRELLPRLQKEGVIQRAALGISVSAIPPERSPAGLGPRSPGAFVAGVIAQGPAARAGLREGDVIIELGGHEIDSPERLRWWASLSEIGKPTPLLVLRGGEKVMLTAVPVPLSEPRRVRRDLGF